MWRLVMGAREATKMFGQFDEIPQCAEAWLVPSSMTEAAADGFGVVGKSEAQWRAFMKPTAEVVVLRSGSVITTSDRS